jgi:hypothetical protein
VNLIEEYNVEPPFVTAFLLPSTAEVIIVSGGRVSAGCGVVEITDTVLDSKLTTYMLPLVES